MNLWTRLRFAAALCGGKLWLEWIKLKGKPRNDRPGMVSLRLFPDFLYYVAKPKLTIVVSGTNGKTTISGMVTDMLRAEGMRVTFNDWGANHHAGVARNLLEAVSWFNKPVADAAVIELDELISPEDMPALQPDYIIVNNLSRDSMLCNGHPGYIRSRLEMAIQSANRAAVILNADDPISCHLGQGHKRVWFGVTPLERRSFPHLANDYAVCPACGAVPEYEYHTYRHLGKVRCPKCGLASPAPDYFVTDCDLKNQRITVEEKAGKFSYPIPSDSVHNVANAACVVALFRTMGYTQERLAELLKSAHILPSRETHEVVRGVELHTQIAKAQNPTAVSTVLEQLANDPSSKEIVMILDEHFDHPLKTETVAWEYDSDFEIFNSMNVRHIVFTGPRRLDMRLRLLMAGIPAEKLIMTETEEQAADAADWHGADKVFVLHDVNAITRGRKIRDRIHARIEVEGGRA